MGNANFKIDATRSHIEQLRLRSKSAPISEATLLQEAFFELNESLYELSVAEEELNIQTEQLQASRDVIESERVKYQQFFDLAPDGYLVTDKYGIIREANSAAQAMLNQKHRHLIGKPLTMFLASDERRHFQDRLGELRRKPKIAGWETVFKPAGNVPAFDASLTVGLDADSLDNANVIRWIFRDITEQKRDKARLISLNQELEQRVAERTRQLEEAYSHEHKIAEVLEQALLHTTAVKCDTIDAETFHEAALEEAGVGGDFYDVFGFQRKEDDGTASEYLAVVVGDVSGKGLHAAVCAASVKFTLRALIRREGRIEEVFARLNDFIRISKQHGDWNDIGRGGESHVELFVVLAVCIVNQATGACELITAGTEPVLAIRLNGSFQEITTKSMALGIVDDCRYTRLEHQLQPHEVLALATDGISEARSGGRFFGTEGIVASLLETHGSSLRSRAEHVISAARRQSDGVFTDDVCLVLAERK